MRHKCQICGRPTACFPNCVPCKFWAYRVWEILFLKIKRAHGAWMW